VRRIPEISKNRNLEGFLSLLNLWYLLSMGRKTHKKNHNHKSMPIVAHSKPNLKQWQQKLQYVKEIAPLLRAHKSQKLKKKFSLHKW
jgi:hypothetical protein